jgi:hypothetical protein
MRSGTLAMEVDYADIVDLRGPFDQRLEEHFWRCGGAVEIDLVAAPDPGDGFGWADELHIDQCG